MITVMRRFLCITVMRIKGKTIKHDKIFFKQNTISQLFLWILGWNITQVHVLDTLRRILPSKLLNMLEMYIYDECENVKWLQLFEKYYINRLK